MSYDLFKTLKNLNIKADWVGLREVQEKTQVRYVRNGFPESNSTNLNQGVMVEVLVDGQFAYYGTTSVTEKGIEKAAEIAVSLAKKAKHYSLFPFSLKHRPKAIGEYRSPRTLEIDTYSAGEINDILSLSCDKMKKNDSVVECGGQVMVVDTNTHFVSTNGSDFRSNLTMINYSLSATANKDGDTQTRSWGNVGQMGFEALDKELFLNNAQRIGKEASELLDAEECPTETMDLILSPDQLVLQVHESIGHPLELDRILGDERNYAGWSFVKPTDFGNLKYGSDKLNITFDPTVSGELASHKIDDTGAEATKEYLIKDGVLVRGIGSLESQERLNLPGVSCARSSSWNRAPIDRMANINLETGDSSTEEMIKSVKKGVIMYTNRSWSIDDYRNKFQFGCEYGKLIENGKLTKTLKNPNYRGVSTPFWNHLKMVGDESTAEVQGSFYCGKGEPNQVIRVGHKVPTCLFENVEVFGGH